MVRQLEYVTQSVDTYAHLPKIRHPDGTRKCVDNADLWFASKINATLKKGSASDVYWEKKALSIEKQTKFVEGVRNHSWNRQRTARQMCIDPIVWTDAGPKAYKPSR